MNMIVFTKQEAATTPQTYHIWYMFMYIDQSVNTSSLYCCYHCGFEPKCIFTLVLGPVASTVLLEHTFKHICLINGKCASKHGDVCKPKFHSWGRCTIALTTMHSDLRFNPSSGLCIILYYNTVESGHYLYRCDDCMTGPYHNTGELAKSKMGSGEDRS